ncbi:MAG: Crp/Fnr family transcriptional regulator [Saprospiraceae bacterium]
MSQYTEQVKQIIQSYCPISLNSYEALSHVLKPEPYPKGNDFIKKDRRNNKEYFLTEGIVKSYVLDPEGVEITLSFFTGPSVLAPHSTRTRNGISNVSFKALTEIELATADAKEFELLMIEHLDIRAFGHRVLENELLQKIEKEIGLASLSAKERLIRFREKHPVLESLVPHTDIATYLGITNVSLSRLRKELMP